MFIVKTLNENRSKTTTRILNTQIRGTRYFLHILAQVMPKFTEKSGMTFAKIGHIERLKFAGTEINQHWQNIGHLSMVIAFQWLKI